MSNKLSVKAILRKVINIFLWIGILFPMLFYIYLFIKQYVIFSADGYGFLDTVFEAWQRCSAMLLKLLIISGIFVVIKGITMIPVMINKVYSYKQGISVFDVVVAESIDALNAMDCDEFLKKYASSMYKPADVVALLPVALYTLSVNQAEGRKMLSILLNVDENTDDFIALANATEKQILEKPYIPLSYFGGALPENNYLISGAATVTVKMADENTDDMFEKILYIGCGGSGSYRPITVKTARKSALKKSSNKMLNSIKANDDIWFVSDFPSILVSVKPPEN